MNYPSALLSDPTQLIKYPIGFYAVQPNAFDVARKDYLSVYESDSGLPFAEQLYTARGSQSVGLGTY
jgi:hypothetical protein